MSEQINYSEALFNAVDKIVSERLNGLSFDRTEACTIIRQDTIDTSKYWVNNGKISYDAYATNEKTSYKQGETIYVTIPQGNYDLRKIIIGTENSVLSSNEAEKSNPFDNLIKFQEFDFTDECVLTTKGVGGNAKSISYNNISILNSAFGQVDTIGISFSLDIDIEDEKQGQYMIQLELLNSEGKNIYQSENLQALLCFASGQITGNPYAQITQTTHEHLFSIPYTSTIADLYMVKGLKVALVEKSGFSDKNKGKTITLSNVQVIFGFNTNDFEYETQELRIELDGQSDFYYGDPSNTFDRKKQLLMNWYVPQDKVIYGGNIEPGENLNDYTFYWLHYRGEEAYNKDLKALDIEQSGAYWKTVKKFQGKNFNLQNNIRYETNLNINWQKEDYKIGLIFDDIYLIDELNNLIKDKETEIEELRNSLLSNEQELSKLSEELEQAKREYAAMIDPNSPDAITLKASIDEKQKTYDSLELEIDAIPETISQKEDEIDALELQIDKAKNSYIESNSLSFVNVNKTSPTGIVAEDSLRLSLEEGDDGIYTNYGIDNKILAQAQEAHTITVDYVDSNKYKWDNSIQQVVWKVPKYATMIQVDTTASNWDTVSDDNYFLYKNNAGDSAQILTFTLNPQFSFSKTNNTIYCDIIRENHEEVEDVTQEGQKTTVKTEAGEYHGKITLQFGTQGVQGTEYSFNLYPQGKYPVLLYNNYYDSNNIVIQAKLENSKGKNLSLEDKQIKWFYQYNDKIFETTGNENGVGSYIISLNDIQKSKVPNEAEEYVILGAEIKQTVSSGVTKTLRAYYPIPFANSKSENYFIQGPTRIVYNAAGNSPNFDNSAYKLFTLKEKGIQEVEGVNWSIEFNGDRNENYPKLVHETSDGIVNTHLEPLGSLQTEVLSCNIVARSSAPGNAKLFSHPLFITKNLYAYDFINDWDGKTLTIDEENSRILSQSMGAGKINEKGEYSGILMGVVADTSGSNATTGLYGFKDGALRYKLNEKGEFYVGTGAENKIEFKDNNLAIASSDITMKADNFYISNKPEEGQPYINLGDGAFVVTQEGVVKLGAGGTSQISLPTQYAVSNDLESIPNESSWKTAIKDLVNKDDYLYIWTRVLVNASVEGGYNYSQSINDKAETKTQYATALSGAPWHDSKQETDRYYRRVRYIPNVTQAVDVFEGPVELIEGPVGVSLIVKYKAATEKPTVLPANGNDNGWLDTIPTQNENEHIYMIQRLSNVDKWSAPIQITGQDGKDGAVGADGANIKFIYFISAVDMAGQWNSTNLPKLSLVDEENGPWYDSPRGVTSTNKYEYVSVCTSTLDKNNEPQWLDKDWSTPALWSKWGEKGQDGDGIKYVYCLFSNKLDNPSRVAYKDIKAELNNTTPVRGKWSEEPQGTDNSVYPYEYMAQFYTVGQSTPDEEQLSSIPVLWNQWTADGESLIVKYQVAPIDSTPTKPTSTDLTNTKWTDWKNEFVNKLKDNQAIYMIQRLSGVSVWSDPIPINGPKGQIGEPGKDGLNTEYIYCCTNNPNYTWADWPTSETEKDTLPTPSTADLWTNSPSGVTQEKQYEFVSIRTSYYRDNSVEKSWTAWSKPVIWSKWGEKGQDGDGIKYVFYLTNAETAPSAPSWENIKNTLNNTTGGWRDEPQGVSKASKYEYVSQFTITNGQYSNTGSSPTLWNQWVDSLIAKYALSKEKPNKPGLEVDSSIWFDTVPSVVGTGEHIYMIQRFTQDAEWSEPIQISGQDGKAGADGLDIEFIYYLSSSSVNWDNWKDNEDKTKEELTTSFGWSDSPRGISEEDKYEYVSSRSRTGTQTIDNQSGFEEEVPAVSDWTPWKTPVVWSKWGERGQDGDGVKYVYCLSQSNEPMNPPKYGTDFPITNPENGQWTDEPSGVSRIWPYEFVSQFVTTGTEVVVDTIGSTPKIWASLTNDLLVMYKEVLKTDQSATVIKPEVDKETQSGWVSTIPTIKTTTYQIYMIQRLLLDDVWSEPIPLIGEKGEQGEIGKDGANIEFIYSRVTSISEIKNPNEDASKWTPSPQGVTETYKYEYVSMRTTAAGSDKWGKWSAPAIWSKWGEKGQDGDGVKYAFYLTNSSTPPATPPTCTKNGNVYSFTSGWFEDPQGVTESKRYEYVSQFNITATGKEFEGSTPRLWSQYANELLTKYCTVTDEKAAPPEKPAVGEEDTSIWQLNFEITDDVVQVYMIQRLLSDSEWSGPIPLIGEKGQTGQDGPAGKDGETIEFVYHLIPEGQHFSTYDVDGPGEDSTEEWTDSPTGINQKQQTEYVSMRTKAAGSDKWGKWSDPVIWSQWGEKGQDGDGVKYIYCQSNIDPDKIDKNNHTPIYNGKDFTSTLGNWTDEPKGVSQDNWYEYVSQFKVIGGTITKDLKGSAPALWSKYSMDGAAAHVISLDNDFVTLIRKRNGVIEGATEEGNNYLIKTNIRVMQGGENITSSINIDDPTKSKLTYNCYSDADNNPCVVSFSHEQGNAVITLTISIPKSKINELSMGRVDLTYNNKAATKSFEFKIINDIEDYNLIVNPRVVNKNTTPASTTITIQAKGTDGQVYTFGSGSFPSSLEVFVGGSKLTSTKLTVGNLSTNNTLIELKYDGEVIDQETIILVANGATGPSLEIQYGTSVTGPWSSNVPAGDLVYMIQKMSNETTWSTPIQISGREGAPGADGQDIEFIYRRFQNAMGSNDWLATDSKLSLEELEKKGWKDKPQGISEINKYEYVSTRTRKGTHNDDWSDFSNNETANPWSDWSTPVIWSKWGEKGQDGDGIKYVYHLYETAQTFSSGFKYSNIKNQISGTPGPSVWTDEPQGVTHTYQYEYVSQYKAVGGTVADNEVGSIPVVWSQYAESPYLVTLSDTYDVLVRHNGALSETSKTINIQVFEGATEITTIQSGQLYAKYETGQGYTATISNKQLTIKITDDKINGGDIIVQYGNNLNTSSEVVKASQTFSFKIVNEYQDYNLVVTPQVINRSNLTGSATQAINIQVKTGNTVYQATGTNYNLPSTIKVYTKRNSENWAQLTSSSHSPTVNTSTTSYAIKVEVDGIKFDEEYLSFVTNGAPGAPGANGTNGKSVTRSYYRYHFNTSTTAPSNTSTGWSDNYTTIFNSYANSTSTNKYIWTQTITEYSDGTKTYGTASYKSADSVIAGWMKLNGAQVMISGGAIAANTITTNKLSTDAIKSNGYVANSTGSFLDLSNGSFHSRYFRINGSTGEVSAGPHTSPHFKVFGTTEEGSYGVVQVGGWKARDNHFYHYTGANSSSYLAHTFKTDGSVAIGLNCPINYRNTSGAALQIWHDGTFKSGRYGYSKPLPSNWDDRQYLGENFYGLYNFVVNSNGTLSIGRRGDGGYNFVVNTDGTITAKNITVNGTINSSKIVSTTFGSKGLTGMADSTGGKYGIYGTAWTLGGRSIESFTNTNNKYTGGYAFLASYTCLIGAVSDGATVSQLSCDTDGKLGLIGTKSASWSSSSDKRVKHEIEDLEVNYEVLFDKLKPIKYKYNDGTSNRFHTGFIAQDVEQSILESELTNQDFAALTIQNPGTELELYGLRYEEFVSLNTWQIQKLKTRVAELEKEIKEIKQRYEI